VKKNPVEIGLISDTHGLLREEAIRALQGSDLIIHAGDIGKPEILDALKKIAPVVAVTGNIEQGAAAPAWARELPATAIAELGPVTIYVIHDLHMLDVTPVAAGFQIVVSGHSHRPSRTERDGVLYVNPGSAGPRRFQLPVSIARLDLSQTPYAVDFIELC
jgi:uncharacterized protein